MTSKHAARASTRWIPVADAARLIGQRFHPGWSDRDVEMLAHDQNNASDKEAWHRAKHVEETLHTFIADGSVTSYAATDDGLGMTVLPFNWVSDTVFTLRLQTGQFTLDLNKWEPLWVNKLELESALPSNGRLRKKHSAEWGPIIHEAWCFAIQHGSIPTNAEIVRHLGDWCPNNNQAVPDGSHLSKAAKAVLDAINENKKGWQNLKSGSCEASGESPA